MFKLEVEGISISYRGESILDDMSFNVKENEFVAILGPSGCGKSTLLGILAGIIPPLSGRVWVDGVRLKGLSPHFAYMPQDDLLMPWKRIIDNVCLYGAIHGRRSKMRGEAMERLSDFGLSGYEHSYPSELSGGMRQRAAFARTSLCGADILLLDEPFAALDVITRGDMWEWLLGIRDALNRTTVLVTHDVDEAIYLADRIFVLGGRPAVIRRELIIGEKFRSREWLLSQTDTRAEIYALLRDSAI